MEAVEQKYRQKVELWALGVSEVWLLDWEGKVEHVDDWVWGYRWGSQDPLPIRLWTFFLFNGELLIPFVLVRGALPMTCLATSGFRMGSANSGFKFHALGCTGFGSS